MKKPAVVLVHGLRGAPVGLEAVAAKLREAGYQVFLPAVPPFAGAEPLEECTLEAYAQFLADWVGAQGLERPILVGHSMGSMAVAAAAHYHPETFDSRVVLLSPISARPAGIFRKLAPLAAELPRRWVDYVTTSFLFCDREKLAETRRLTNKSSGMTVAPKVALKAAAKMAAEHAVSETPPAEGQKVLMIAGVKDRLVPQKATLRLAAEWGAEVVLLGGTGHLHNYERPNETAEAILAFLSPSALV